MASSDVVVELLVDLSGWPTPTGVDFVCGFSWTCPRGLLNHDLLLGDRLDQLNFFADIAHSVAHHGSCETFSRRLLRSKWRGSTTTSGLVADDA